MRHEHMAALNVLLAHGMFVYICVYCLKNLCVKGFRKSFFDVKRPCHRLLLEDERGLAHPIDEDTLVGMGSWDQEEHHPSRSERLDLLPWVAS